MRDVRLRRRFGAVLRGAVVATFLMSAVLPATASAARHYEMVSPLDKGQGDIVGDGLTTVASRFGDAVAFASRTPFGDTVGSGWDGQSQYVARRSEGGWVTHAITPRPRPDAVQTFFTSTWLQIYSDDLTAAVVRAYDLPDVTGDTPLRNNLYVEDTATRELVPVSVSQMDQPTLFDFLSLTFWAVSADAHHLTFVPPVSPFTGVPTRFLPEAAPGVSNVYQWDNGVLRVAGVLPDGSVPASGSDLIPANYRNAMSADGSRLVFTVPSSSYGPSQLFMRIASSRTVWISQPELRDDSQNASNPSSAALQGVTPDGHTVFFTTDAGLVDSDTNGTTDLYRYIDSAHPANDRGNLTMISTGGDMSGGEVVGMSDDGQRVYYQTPANRLSVWDHGTARLISDAVAFQGNPARRLGVMDGEPGLGRATPDGRYLAFQVDSANQQDFLGNPTNGHWEMYLYDIDSDTLRCVSCPTGRATADLAFRVEVTSGSPQQINVGFRPRFLSDRGQVFFSTADPLVPEDRNGVADAYEYDAATGTISLLSTGKGSDPANFADASASGNDVFIVTRQRLASQDTDDLVDVYDVRDGSTLPSPPKAPAAPCQAEGCKPPPAVSPSTNPLGSSNFDQNVRGRQRTSLVVPRRITLRGASGLVRVKITTAGALAWSGHSITAGSIRHAKAGAHAVRLRLARHARTRLRIAGVYRTAVHLTFVSAGGAEVRRTVRITFRAVAKKGR